MNPSKNQYADEMLKKQTEAAKDECEPRPFGAAGVTESEALGTDAIRRASAVGMSVLENTGAPYTHGHSDERLLQHIFSYHTPRPEQLERYAAIREAAKHFARVVMLTTPPGADRSAALRKIREAVMTANASVALDGISF